MRGWIDSRELSRELAGRPCDTFDLDYLADLDRHLDSVLTRLESDWRIRLPEGTRLAGLKRFLLRALKVYTRHQRGVNQRMLESLRLLQRRQRLLEAHLRSQLSPPDEQD